MHKSSARLACLVLMTLLAGPFLPASSQAPPPAADPPAGSEAASLGIQEIRLDNGLRLFVLERPSTPTFAALYQFGVGSLTDPKGRSGIAHVLEHMMFKGTQQIGVLDAEKEAVLIERLDSLWSRLYDELDRQDDPFQAADEEKIAALTAEIEKVSARAKGAGRQERVRRVDDPGRCGGPQRLDRLGHDPLHRPTAVQPVGVLVPPGERRG